MRFNTTYTHFYCPKILPQIVTLNGDYIQICIHVLIIRIEMNVNVNPENISQKLFKSTANDGDVKSHT